VKPDPAKQNPTKSTLSTQSAPRLGGAGRVMRELGKPVYSLYYRFLYGRSFPGSAALAARIRAFERTSRRGDLPASRAQWEEEYSRGDWGFLAYLAEVARHELLARQLRRSMPARGRLLDVESGEGILYQHVGDAGYRYTGVDLSQVAIDKARERWPPDADGAPYSSPPTPLPTSPPSRRRRWCSTSASTTSPNPWPKPNATSICSLPAG
jgi:hypothetical protein